jgi:hypothetical protein
MNLELDRVPDEIFATPGRVLRPLGLGRAYEQAQDDLISFMLFFFFFRFQLKLRSCKINIKSNKYRKITNSIFWTHGNMIYTFHI